MTLAALLLLRAALQAADPATTSPATGELLTLDQALLNSDDHQPLILQALAQAQAARARVDENRGPLLPQVVGTAGLYYSDAFGGYSGAGVTTTTTTTPAGSGAGSGSGTGGAAGLGSGLGGTALGTGYGSFAGRTQLGLTAQQLLWDFGQTWDRFRSFEVAQDQYRFTAEEQKVQSHLAVRSAFYNARAQKALLQVANETLENERKHLVQTEGMVKAGTKADIALAQEKATTASDEFQAIQAVGNYATGKSQLNQAMGIEGPIDYEVQEIDAPPVEGEDRTTDDLMVEALKARPAYEAIDRQVDAQLYLISSYRGAYWPSLSLLGGVQAYATRPNDFQGNLFGELALNWVMFNGGTNYANVREQKANLLVLQGQRDQLRQQIRVDLETARLQVVTAKSGLTSAESAVVNARELLRLAEGQYTAGVGSIIQLGDAQVQYTSAEVQRIQAYYTLNNARATLLAKLGQG